MDSSEASLYTNKSKMDEEISCGLFNWRPKSLQKFVTYKYYVLVYVFISIAQSMVFSYLTVVLSTIEKQFGLKVCLSRRINNLLLTFVELYHRKLYKVFLVFLHSPKKRPGFILETKLVKFVSSSVFHLLVEYKRNH